MKLVGRKLIADEGKHIRSIDDVYTPESKDEEGNIIPEHFPYYTDVIYLGVQIQTLEEAEKIYVEENI